MTRCFKSEMSSGESFATQSSTDCLIVRGVLFSYRT